MPRCVGTLKCQASKFVKATMFRRRDVSRWVSMGFRDSSLRGLPKKYFRLLVGAFVGYLVGYCWLASL